MKTLVDLLRYAIVLACAVTLPNSIGRLRLSSRDPHAAPHVRDTFFVDPNDLDRLVEVVGLSRKIGRTAPFSDPIDHEIAPGNAADDGEALRTNIVDTVVSLPASDIDRADGGGRLERFLNPSSPGRIRSLIFHERRSAMTVVRKFWRNRKESKEWARRLQSEDPGLEVVHPQSAGIDVGNSAHYVAVRPDRDAEPVRRFECFTADLHRMADGLQSCGVKTVAMQSTGVYWIPLYEILEARGFEVHRVNARHTKNLPGRKSDVQESQWWLKLHTYGLLNNSFQPLSEIRVLRSYWRQRAEHVRGAATCI
jgi:hypothetical protein